MSEEPKKLVNVVTSIDRSATDIEGTPVMLSLLEGWDELDDRRQKYLTVYAEHPNEKTKCAMLLGYKISEVNRWFTEETFSLVASQIFDIHTEALKDVDFKDSITNSKIRARVIQARENGNKYTKESKKGNSQHLHLHDIKLSDIVKLNSP